MIKLQNPIDICSAQYQNSINTFHKPLRSSRYGREVIVLKGIIGIITNNQGGARNAKQSGNKGV
jgi:hypothetical protein